MGISSYKYKSVSTDFAVFLNTFLIISTVIVFAVLIFISFQSISNEYISNNMADTASICSDISVDYLKITEAYPDDQKEKDSLINMYLASNLIEDKVAAYIVDRNGVIQYANDIAYYGDDVNTLIRSTIESVNAEQGIWQDYRELTATSAEIVTGMKIGDTGLYSVVIHKMDQTNFIDAYLSIIVYPTLVSLVAAIALFIGFVGLTIRPLREISKTVSKVSDGDLTARVDDKYTKLGDSTGMLTLSSDLTEMAQDINSMIESLENQENDRSVFISSVAHDIRTPLTSINGFVTAMIDGTIPPELHEKYLTKIKVEVDKIRSLVVSMTEASSLSHVEPDLMDEFDIKEAVEELVESLEPQLAAKNITVETRINEEGGTRVYGEIQMLCRVLLNIVTNAVKFTPEGGKIIISSESDRKTCRYISVEDSGPGVEPEKRSRVFESFYKADPSRKHEGFGLGLYICKQILTGHGQTIRLDESRELGGAKFIFSFPLPPKKD